MRSIAVAGRYARALADLAGPKDVKALEGVIGEMALLARILPTGSDLQKWLDSPTTAAAHQAEALQSLTAKARLTDLSRRFLEVLAQNRRVEALPAIVEALGLIRDEATGIVPAETTVAVKMSDAETAGFKKALETMTGRTIRLTVKVDPGVLGGAMTQIGSRVYDGTLRGRLDAMHRRMAGTG